MSDIKEKNIIFDILIPGNGTVDTSFNVGTGADNNKINTILYL